MSPQTVMQTSFITRIGVTLLLAGTPFLGACSTTHSHPSAHHNHSVISPKEKEDRDWEQKRRKEIERRHDPSEPIPPAQPGTPRAPQIPPWTPKKDKQTNPPAPDAPAPTSVTK